MYDDLDESTRTAWPVGPGLVWPGSGEVADGHRDGRQYGIAVGSEFGMPVHDVEPSLFGERDRPLSVGRSYLGVGHVPGS